jgi:8-oxo-dGTP pyrophosphatase MutT (NUDIX family)
MEASLRAHRPEEPADPPRKRSGVAALLELSAEGPGPRVLVMRRAEHPDDPWSGHCSLPGGHLDPGDADLLAAVRRETREEVGLDLDSTARLVGRLDPIRATARGVVLPLDVTPFVFAREGADEPVPGEEAQEVFWLPLDRAVAGELDSEHRVERGGLTHRYPCWEFEGRVVWGLTYRILRGLLRTAGAPLQDGS